MAAITVVDDDKLILQAVVLALRSEGYDVEPFDVPIVALPKVIFAPPPLLILNGHMPGLHGIDFFLQYRQTSRRPVMILSASADEIADQLTALGCPANAYLCKPFSCRHLVSMFDAVLQR